MKHFVLVFVLLLSACTGAPVVPESHKPEVIAKLTLEEANAQLAAVDAELDTIEEEIRSLESRHDRLRMGSNAQKNAELEGVGGELAAANSRKGALQGRQQLLERRRRELSN